MYGLADIVYALEGVDLDESELQEPFEFNPIPALAAAQFASDADSAVEALRLVEEQIGYGNATLRGINFGMIKLRRSLDSGLDVSDEGLRRYVHDLHVAAYDLKSRTGSQESAKRHLARAIACGSDRNAARLRLIEFYLAQERVHSRGKCLARRAGAGGCLNLRFRLSMLVACA